jgi:hypothetical protein
MAELVPCPLCDTPRPADERCPSCGLTPEFGPDASDPFTGRVAWLLAGAVLGVFALTLLVVALTS